MSIIEHRFVCRPSCSPVTELPLLQIQKVRNPHIHFPVHHDMIYENDQQDATV